MSSAAFSSRERETDRFSAGLEHTGHQLAAIKCLTNAVLFDYDHGENFDGFVGGKPIVAFEAFPPAADAGTVVGGTGVYNLAVEGGTERAFHRAETS